MGRIPWRTSIYGGLRAQLPKLWPTVCVLVPISLPSGLFKLTLSSSFGPNTFPAHNSVLFASEVQVEYLARTLLAPIIDHRISSLEVKPTAENQWVNSLQAELKGSVFEAGCSNWYINPHGRNSASWPGYASTYWKETLKPQVGVFNKVYRSKFWIGNSVWRWIRTTKKETYIMLFLSLAGFIWHHKGPSADQLPFIYRKIVS